MNRLIELKQATPLILFALVYFGLLPTTHAVSPPPDGGYPGGNTAEGQSALLSLTSGANNTAVGWLSLRAVTDGQLNTAIGAATLSANTGNLNTAIGRRRAFQQHHWYRQHGQRCLSSPSQHQRQQQHGQRL